MGMAFIYFSLVVLLSHTRTRARFKLKYENIYTVFV